MVFELSTYSQTRQNLAKLLDDARLDAEVQVRQRNGLTFVLKPAKKNKSRLNFTDDLADISLDEPHKTGKECSVVISSSDKVS